MELAVLLAAGLREWIDFGVIIGILLLNAVVGWYQEKQAADVVASLKADIAMKAVVVRDGQEIEIKAREIVPGDIVILEEGQVIPGDARLICGYDNPAGYADYLDFMNSDTSTEAKSEEDEDDALDEHRNKIGHALVAADQSSITGESLAVDKFMGDMVYYTTGCKRGKAYAIITTPAKTVIRRSDSFYGSRCSRSGSFQGYHELYWNSLAGFGCFLDLACLDRWILSPLEHCYSRKLSSKTSCTTLYSFDCWCSSWFARCYYHHPGCRCCLSCKGEGHCSKTYCH